VADGALVRFTLDGDTLARGYWKREDLTAERSLSGHSAREPNAAFTGRGTWVAGSPTMH